ncbi:DUF6502 family protein [Variovorax sp. J22R133]|uniref:DUF6502 family protein n=1 Tax=Variovorax brevis TaxID=3053503 RepID=UPI0025768E14|nr:DUF6502 family protein [Variovorax sp. J22R133]MDM0114780.1 DUF6502 family protein [Variovorax sp. J22R133]
MDNTEPAGVNSNEAPQGRLPWALATCARVMRPLVRLALALGVKHAHLERLLRELLLDEARRAWRQSKGSEPNISQLSVTTGLNRKALTNRVRVADLPSLDAEMSAASKVLTLWLQMCRDDPGLQTLPVVTQANAVSFESIAHRASRGNVHHRAILDELVRLNMAVEQDGRAQLNATAFVPSSDMKGMLAFLGTNAGDHLLAGVSNALGAKPELLERSVFAAGISMEECERIHQLARIRWDALHHELTHEMTRAFEGADKSATGRIRVGIYTYYEDGAAESVKTPGREE